MQRNGSNHDRNGLNGHVREAPLEGYVFHSYGPDSYLKQVIASVSTLRRHDRRRPVALYCSEHQAESLRASGLAAMFNRVELLPEANQSVVGFKHHLHQFMPYERCLYVDVDTVWCRDPDALWKHLSGFSFTATGVERSDFFFGGPKGGMVVFDYLLDRRRRTMKRFGLTHLPRVQAGMMYASDRRLAERVCAAAAHYFERRGLTHFRSRLDEGRNEESCEWSLAMAMSSMQLPIFPWLQGANSPQLDFVDELTDHDADFKKVACRYYTDRFVYSLRGIPSKSAREALTRLFSALPGRGDYVSVTPYVLHFGFLHHKRAFLDFADRTWAKLVEQATSSTRSGDALDAAWADDEGADALDLVVSGGNSAAEGLRGGG